MIRRATIVVTQRERFGLSERSLDSVYSETEIPFALVYVDAGSPPSVESLLDREARRRSFTLLRIGRYVPPNVARDIAMAYVDTELVVFIDNDVLVRRGWLQALIDCADETGAVAVGSLYLEGEPGKEKVHMAGGTISIEEREGRKVFSDPHDHSHADMAETVHLERKIVDFVEFHCLLTRTPKVREIGGPDRRLLSLLEHVDFCMRLRQDGGAIYLDPRSVVTYVAPPPLDRGDVRIFLRRWSERWARETLKHFGAKWGVEVWPGPAQFSRSQRQIVFDPMLRKVSGILGARNRPRINWLLRRLEAGSNWLLFRSRPELNPEDHGLVRVVVP